MMPEEAAAWPWGPRLDTWTPRRCSRLTHAAAELAAEPGVHARLRSAVRRKACVDAPTPEGTETIDPLHPLAGVKRLQNKPLYEFAGNEFAAVLKAYATGYRAAHRLPGGGRGDERDGSDVLSRGRQFHGGRVECATQGRARRGVRKLLIKSLAREASIAMERESLAEARLGGSQKLWIASRSVAPGGARGS